MKLFTIFFVLLLNLSSILARVNLDSGLVAFYPFNSNANDESGNNNHGVVNGPILTTDRNGNDSSAFEFDGTSNYISVANSPSLQSPSTELTQVRMD